MKLIEKLQEATDEQRSLLDQLRLWHEVQAQGINPEDVAAFTLKEEWIPDAKKYRTEGRKLQHTPNPYVESNGRLKLYNAVKLKDGSYKQLNPPLRRPIGS
jgi:hypothetical protein